MSDEQRRSVSRGMAAESEQLLGVSAHKEQYYAHDEVPRDKAEDMRRRFIELELSAT